MSLPVIAATLCAIGVRAHLVRGLRRAARPGTDCVPPAAHEADRREPIG
ncbi:hypothetical protein [Frankia sp. QA3]|nr:hypothetical protein [Frankia sp. QA3]EIV93471.1 hypothetical protein FraQA3DRAFT_3168 [Frankia sp. QA3]